MSRAHIAWTLLASYLLLACGARSTAPRAPSLVGGQRRVVVPCDPAFTALTVSACQKACPAPAAGEQLTSCADAPSSELARDRLAPMARALLLCRYEVKR